MNERVTLFRKKLMQKYGAAPLIQEVVMVAGQDKINRIKGFFGEVVGEMKKCTWPQKQELIESTIVVIVSIFLLAGFVAVSDVVLIELMKFVFP